MREQIFASEKVNFYSSMVKKAVKYGVSLDDIMLETQKYHGKEFVTRIKENLKEIL